MVVAVMMTILLGLIAVGLLSLSTIEVRSANVGNNQQLAQANARLALTVAIGELQTFLGPDQRVSALGSILEADSEVAHPHWVGVWSTRQENGESFWTRDDLNGGLRDERWEGEEEWIASEKVLSYLVSGNEGGKAGSPRFASAEQEQEGELGSSWVQLVGSGSLGSVVDLTRGAVRVPKVSIAQSNGQRGNYAYWVGDLGVRANIGTPNAWAQEDRNFSPENESFEVMVSQEVDATVISSPSGQEIEPLTQRQRESLITDGQVALLTSEEDWSEGLWHDITTWSKGVLADSRDGGLRKDLTVYLKEDSFSSLNSGSDSLNDSDNLVGARNARHASQIGQEWESGRYLRSSPTFGMLRDWVSNAADLHADVQRQRNPETEFIDSTQAGARSAFANDESVRLTERVRTDLRPILVEGSMYSTFSYHPNPLGFRKTFNIRSHQWPRVVLWNPYNVPIEIPQSVIMMQLNTRNDFETSIDIPILDRFFRSSVQWISWGGGTRTPPPRPGEEITESANYNDPYAGMRYYSLPNETIGPGECLFFSPSQAAEYNPSNILANTLSAAVAPDPSRNFYVSSSEFDEDDTGSGFDFLIIDYRYNPARNLHNQADDARMIWKDATGYSSAGIFDFDGMPQLHSVSCSLQYGAGKEPRVSWNESNSIPVEFTSLRNPVVTNKPDVRSREGFRLRWLEEHPSNVGVLNNPAGPTAMETALLANWNPRASFAIRSPWSNISGDVGDGLASGPWFFGAYTRDLYDSLVGWDEQLPFFRDGRFRGNPFGPPQEGRLRNILFEVPREEIGLLSLAQLQHVKLSEFVWHPSYAIGNSLVDPRLGQDGVNGTAPILLDEDNGGWNSDAIGFSDDLERAEDADEWARFARFIMKELPEDENLVYDLSYEVNHSLWDEFFLSSGTDRQRELFVSEGEPLPNGRMELIPSGTERDLEDVNRAASKLMVDGAFNVNSTSVEAWKALLASTRQSGFSPTKSTPFPRNPQARSDEFLSDSFFADDDEAWEGFRSLTDEEIDTLAQEIVEQVKLRGPFLSLSDFVNRRLVNYRPGDESALMGPLQAAIESANLNAVFEDRWELEKQGGDLPDYAHPDQIQDATRLSQTLKPSSKAWGAPGYLTQADLLQVIGPVLSARSDTFLIRSYGEAVNNAGQVTARAWCEAVVQRTPEPLASDEEGLNPDPETPNGVYGRKFELRSFRWLSEDEV